MNKRDVRNLDLGYSCLIVLLFIEQALVFLSVYQNQTYPAWALGASVGALAAMAAGYWLPAGFSVVIAFLFFVSYFVWQTIYGFHEVLQVAWILIIPANLMVASFVRNRIIRMKRILERLNALKDQNPVLDLQTGLGNYDAFADALLKQATLAARYNNKYGFSLALFKIDFLPLVMESVGAGRYAQFLVEISNTMQQQIRNEDSKFSIDNGRFLILCPLTEHAYFSTVVERVKTAMMNLSFEDKNGEPLKLVVRASLMHFDKEQFDLFTHADQLIATLDRRTEIDLIAEYV